MSSPSEISPPVTIQELSRDLGYSVPTLRRWVKQGRIPVCQPGGKGGKLTFRLDAVLRAVDSAATVMTTTPLNQISLRGPRPKWAKRGRV